METTISQTVDGDSGSTDRPGGILCARCKKDCSAHCYMMFGKQGGQCGYWNMCPACHDELRRVPPVESGCFGKKRKRGWD